MHAKPLSSSAIFLTFAFSLGASSKDSESGRSVVLGKCFLRGRSCCEGWQPLLLRESDRALDVDPRTEGAASREIVFPLNLDSEVQKPRAPGPSAWGVQTKAATKQSLWSKTQSRPAVLSACRPAVAGVEAAQIGPRLRQGARGWAARLALGWQCSLVAFLALLRKLLLMRSCRSDGPGLDGKCEEEPTGVMVTSTVSGEELPFEEGIVRVQGEKNAGQEALTESVPCPALEGEQWMAPHVTSAPSTCCPPARPGGTLGGKEVMQKGKRISA